ncbi:M23 family metallopeptidase [Pseudomonadota bacterium]
MRKGLKALKKYFFQKREIILVSNNKIRAEEIGFSKFCLLFGFFCWIVFSSVKFFEYRVIIDRKVAEIKNLSKINSYFRSEIDFYSSNLKSIHSYIQVLNEYDRFAGIDINYDENKIIVKSPNLLPPEVKLTDFDKDVMYKIADTSYELQEIQKNVRKRTTGIEKLIAMTGLAKEKEVDKFVEAGKILEGDSFLANYNGHNYIAKNIIENKAISDGGMLSFASLQNDVKYLKNLESIIDDMPLTLPMKNYYISSNFGKRINPVTRRRTIHIGLDMAGPLRAPIYATGDGVITFAGRKGSYGNLVKIKHSSGLSTYYGHLSKIKVNKGDIVQRGNLIGYQGNTGRSTGSHLHYEVRYKDEPYNPKKFLLMGDKLF